MEPVSIAHEEWTSFFVELKEESDRAAVILVAAYIDSLLQAKLKALFCKGNSKVRSKLFDSEGAFATLSAKADATYCLGWLKPNVFHDIGIIRKVRNEFAHRIHGLTLEEAKIKTLLHELRIPRELFSDWDSIKWGALRDNTGIVLFSDETDSDIDDISDLPAGFMFRMAASRVLGILAKNLELCFHGVDGSPLKFRLINEVEE